MIIEDNEDDVIVIKEYLADSELLTRLEYAHSIELGLDILSRGKIDVVLLDLGLPGCGELDAFERISRVASHIPIIIMTGIADQERAAMAISHGAQDYLVKGQFTGELLDRSIRYAIERKRYDKALRVSEARFRQANRELSRTVKELKEANQKILENQKSVIEEERLKAILEMSNTTAHELNQPLTALLGNIELMRLRKCDSHHIEPYLAVIEKSGLRIADIVKKIHALRFDEKTPYIGDSFMINLHQAINLLSVEDSDFDFETIRNLIKDDDMINLSRAKTTVDAMNLLEEKPFDLIILDHILPDGNGLDFFKYLKKRDVDIPVVVNTAHGDEVIAAQFIKEGAYDYLDKKYITKKSLYRSINNALEKFRLKKEIKLAWEKIAKMATRDELTGLYNRRYFMEVVEREMDRARRYKNRLVFCMIALEHFQDITAAHGILAGDMVLVEIGKILTKCIRVSDLLCRYGDEKFAVILPNTEMDSAQVVCKRFKTLIGDKKFEYDSSLIKVDASIGMAMYDPERDRTSAHLIEKAALALSRSNSN